MIELSGGRDTLSKMLDAYESAWNEFIDNNHLRAFSQSILPTTVSWKVDGHNSLFDNLEQLADRSEQVHIATVNNRFIATIVLIEPCRDMRLLKILERRAGSSDPLGLDSLDYLTENLNAVSDQLNGAADCTLQKDHNEMHNWLSLRFGLTRQFEAKFTDHLVLQVAQKELAQSEKEIINSLGIG